IQDRWSNNISYRQLIISSFIGVYQLCWHPYLHDLRRLIPFMFLYNVFSVVVAYPVLYLELALGVGFSMIACCVFTALAAGAISARCMALLVHSLHSFLPWLHCAAAARPPCAARHRPLPPDAETPAHSFYLHAHVVCAGVLRGGRVAARWRQRLAQGSMIMLGSYCPKQHKLGTTALLALVTSKVTCAIASLTLAAAFSALMKDYDDKVILPSGKKR
ncbi:Transporter, partial [Operophtera brumata]